MYFVHDEQNAVGGEAVVLDAAGNDVTAQFRVNTVNGTLQIAPRQVMLTSATDSKQYDGRPLVRNASTDVVVTGDGFVSGLLYGILKGWAPEDCLHFGWATGAMATTMIEDFATPVDEDQVWNVWKGNARVKS